MMIKKLAVPLINEKLLSQAEHCSIATSAISESGFDFVVSRLPIKCKVEIVTGLQVPTEPKVLTRILRHFTDRVQLKIFTKNIFQANVYIFDLPFRKALAFIGSGNLTPGGLKDNETLFYRISDPKEIEALKSWFIGYYEYSEPLTEKIIQEYEWVFPAMKRRELVSREEAQDVLEISSRAFDWESIRFKNQFFQKEDFLVFANDSISRNTSEVETEREKVRQKMLTLHDTMKGHLSGLKLYEAGEGDQMISHAIPLDSDDEKIRAMWIAYGRSKEALKAYSADAKLLDFMTIIIIIRQKEIGIWLMAGQENSGKEDREYFQLKMGEPEYRKTFFQLLQGLQPEENKKEVIRSPYWIQIAGEKRPLQAFSNDQILFELIKYDDWRLYPFMIGRNYSPGDPAISHDRIGSTITSEFDKLVRIYQHMKHRF